MKILTETKENDWRIKINAHSHTNTYIKWYVIRNANKKKIEIKKQKTKKYIEKKSMLIMCKQKFTKIKLQKKEQKKYYSWH